MTLNRRMKFIVRRADEMLLKSAEKCVLVVESALTRFPLRFSFVSFCFLWRVREVSKQAFRMIMMNDDDALCGDE